jgi:hypothetical protein
VAGARLGDRAACPTIARTAMPPSRDIVRTIRSGAPCSGFTATSRRQNFENISARPM